MTDSALDRQRPRQLLDRLLDTPNLARVVRTLEPGILHKLVRTCGLEDCGEIVALATPEQLRDVFDLDLWSGGTAGKDDRFDAARFGRWLEVLADADLGHAARTIAGLDPGLVVAALMHHVHVVDRMTTPPDALMQLLESAASHEVGGYTIISRRTGSWDAILEVLVQLESEQPTCFHTLMGECRQISVREAVFEEDGFDLLRPAAQLVTDAGFDRDSRRDAQGYVTPGQASAFLESSRRVRLALDRSPEPDPISAGYFRDLDHRHSSHVKSPSRTDSVPARADAAAVRADDDRATFLDALRVAGVIGDAPQVLLAAGSGGDSGGRALERIVQHMQAAGQDAWVSARRSEELAYLANVLVEGCSFDSGRFAAPDAYNAALAVCNLGLENWPVQWPPAADLVPVFQVGWTVLYERVCVHVPRRLIEILSNLDVPHDDVRDELRAIGDRLHRGLAAGTPWRARDYLDALATLDTPSWAILVRLIDQCPVVPDDWDQPPGRALRASSTFDFISENRQIAWAARFVESLPDRLLG